MLKNMIDININNETAIITVNKTDVLKSLNDNIDKLQTEVSFSEYEDSLGYLPENVLNHEMEMYGPDPMWWD